MNPSYPAFLERLGLTSPAASASGALIVDETGRELIDCVAGFGLFNLGHNNPEIVSAVSRSLNTPGLNTRPLIAQESVVLAERLAGILPDGLSCSFLTNSGSEAVDGAIKLARLHTGRAGIVAAENSFHGYTYGALSVSGIPAFTKRFRPMLPEVVHVPYGDLGAMRRAVGPSTAAVVLEPMQHEAGIALPPEGYLSGVSEICARSGAMFILDEIKTGFGKTGSLFSCESEGVTPDILVLGKSMGGGLIPVGALTAGKRLWRKFGFSFPMSASSFAGNKLACHAVLAAIDLVTRDGFLTECRRKAGILHDGLSRIAGYFPDILESVDGKGFLIGLRCAGHSVTQRIARAMIERGVLVLPAFANQSVLMIEPPLVIEESQIRHVTESLMESCHEISSTPRS